MLLQKHPRFRSIIMLQPVVDLMRMLLGDDCVLSSLNGISMTPGGDGQQLHRDSLGFVGHTATVNAVFTLDEFTRENGCTRLVPCSQNIDPSVLSNVETDALASLEQDALYIEAPVGSVIAYEGSLIHAGSPNRTNAPRRALHAFFTRALIKPQWDIPMSLSPEVVKGLTEEQKRLLGFYSRPRRYDYDRDETQGSTSSRALPPVIRQRARRLAKSLLQRMRNWQW
jgi:ectoine hydroxylase-related dioxygenase (phytanoyl-CoA dioxygenase family)